ncbi:basement membrane-specific heparan sulfate proteoglycan core protein-like [Xenia sp. Carnegie-2017]|uniref:basement membrane-specific heparan sulfate proteoglycan core protein-like n=1 Tax=Xenia sp. Carnegie-2017 TaxID=2897299 RepID=UPI001F04E55F|nr:basement membrane-specific heparan sulfate proteoglycan core protein-like [Xenia sp. Carnegie-2017]
MLFYQQFWRFSSNSRISKALFVVFLGRIHKLLILATPYVNMLESRLYNVELESAVESELGTTIPGIERCNCPTGYTGYSCESCAMGYTLSASSFILGSCVKCRCHKHARFCNPLTGECENCQNNTTGKYCERCKPGFYGNARNGSPCQPCPCPRIENISSTEEETTCSLGDDGEPVCDRCPEGHEGKLCNRCQKGFTGNPKVPGEVCTPVSSCGCSHAGTERCDEQTQTCICKANVHGEKCDECKRGFFNLQSGNKDGCSPCFCMGLNTTCSISPEKPDNIKFTPRHPLPSDLIITTENFSQNTSDYLLDRRIKQVRFMYKSWMAMSNIFWRIPRTFVGNKLQFYGGSLTFYYFYLTTSSKNFEIERFITMKGNSMTLHYKEHTLVPANMNKKIEILLSERFWFKANGHSVSRDEFMRVLINIDSILIPVTYSSKFSESRLGDVTLMSANDRTNAGKPEMCDCPDNTIGASCESCVTGYSRNGKTTSFCTPCQCNSHATDCDPTTGVCKDCKNNTDGIHCEICSRGFYGNATSGSKIGCKECPCPLAGLSNRFSETCFMDDDGLPTCDACLDGYTGRRCEKCSANYTGNPLTPGGKCFKAPVLQILQMKIIPEILTVQEGDNARFVCNVKSPRPTKVIWSRSESKTLPRGSTVYGNVLSFTSLQLSDAGAYWCTASNDISLKTARAQLIVEEQQLTAVIVDVAPKSRYIPVGGTAKFFCTSRTSSRHSITWSREHDKAMPLTSQIKDGSLIITNAQLDDGGTYICTGKNSLNIDRAIISLHVGVVVKPEVTVSPRKQTVDVANTVKFRCSASAGFPAATLHWERKDGRRLPRFSKFFTRTGVFKILAASRRDEGEYRCIARNTGGESTMDVLLLVKGPNSAPTVNMRPVSVTVNEGQTTVLRCDVMGEEPMAITWQKKDGKLPARAVMNRNVLEIKNTSIRERDGIFVQRLINMENLQLLAVSS